MSSFTVSLTGKSSELTATFFPELILDDNYDYSCGLLDFTAYHSIPNITEKNNKFYYVLEDNGEISNSCIIVPTGCYEAEDVLDYIKRELTTDGISFEYKINKNTFKTTLKCSAKILFGYSESIFSIFGFDGVYGDVIKANTYRESDGIIKISKLNVIRVEVILLQEPMSMVDSPIPFTNFRVIKWM